VDNYSLVELIIETGVHDAIAKKLNSKGKLSKNAVAEGIVNNVRKTNNRDQLTDPRFYEKISKLLDDLILEWRKQTLTYQEFLQQAEELVKNMASGKGDSPVPEALEGNRPALTLYNNLPDILALAFPTWEIRDDENGEENDLVQITLEIDRAMREQAPANWKGDSTRENQVLNALHPIMGKSREATLALFELIKQQEGYQ
jgi:type I restriction enzyme R subunit